MAQDISEMLGQNPENPGLAKILENPQVAQILANPAFAAMVQNLRQGMGDTPDMGALLEKLPTMMTMLSGMNGTPSAMGENVGGKSATVSASAADTAGATVGAGASETEKAETATMSMQVLFRPEARDKRNKLLSALKPYLSPARCAMIDRAMSAMQLGELLGTMGSPSMDSGAKGQGEG